MATTAIADLVVIDYQCLLQPINDEMLALIEKAYGVDGLGVLAIRGAPDYLPLRNALLPMGYGFGNLPEDVKNKYEHDKSLYSFGWSHGRERLEGKPDIAKGSYYANPLLNQPCDDEELIAKYPGTLHPNIWPSKEDFPGLEEAFMNLGQKIYDVGLLVSKLCDAYVKTQNPDFPDQKLEKCITESKCHKARLLYYYPFESEVSEETLSSWCGAHLDSGSLTGLTSAQFFDENGQEIANPDPKSGLYIKSRSGIDYQVKIPADCIAYQIGECFQIHSSGLLQATPHAVRASSVPGVSRSTFACFMQPQFDYQMALPEKGADIQAVMKGANAEHLPKGVPPLLARWDINGTQTYGEFAEKTFSMYY